MHALLHLLEVEEGLEGDFGDLRGGFGGFKGGLGGFRGGLEDWMIVGVYGKKGDCLE